MKVYLAWYHNGFTDSPSELLGVFASKGKAEKKIDQHCRTADRFCEYKDKASWYVTEWEVVE
jgi:hypothetical protein